MTNNILSLRDLSVITLLGKNDFLQAYNHPRSSTPYSLATQHIRSELEPIVEQFQKCMKSQIGFLETIKNNPDLALIFSKKYPEKIDVNGITTSSRETALHLAAKRGNLRLVKHLIEDRNLNPYAVTVSGKTLLHCAAESGNIVLVKYLIETFHLNVRAVSLGSLRNYWMDSLPGQTLLHWAAKSGNTELVTYLRETYDLNVNAINSFEETVLHYAARSGSRELVTYLIVTCDLNINDVTLDRWTVLHCAAMSGNIELVQYLIETFRLDVKVTDGWYNNALDFAAMKGKIKLVKHLMKTHHLQVKSKTISFAARSKNAKLFRYLIKNGNIDAADLYQSIRRDLDISASVGYTEAINFVLENYHLDRISAVYFKTKCCISRKRTMVRIAVIAGIILISSYVLKKMFPY